MVPYIRPMVPYGGWKYMVYIYCIVNNVYGGHFLYGTGICMVLIFYMVPLVLYDTIQISYKTYDTI